MTIKGIFFDLFGTLVDLTDTKSAWNDWFSTFYDILTHNGLDMTKNNFSVICDDFMSKNEPTGYEKKLTVYEKRIKAMCNELKLSVNYKIINQIAMRTIEEWGKYIKIDPDTIPLLKFLKDKMKLALITNYDHYPYIKNFIKELEIEDFFETITISSEIGKKKPDPDIFIPAIEKSGLKPSEIAYVGDSEGDIIGARLAGMIPVFIKRIRNYPLQDFKTDGIDLKNDSSINLEKVTQIHNLRELKKLVS